MLAIFSTLAAPAWFARAKDGLDSPLLPEDMLGLLTLILVPVQILLIVVSMIAFNQEWHVEEERPIGGPPLAGEDDEYAAPPPAPATSPASEQALLLLAGLDQVRAVLAHAVDEVADLAPGQRPLGRRRQQPAQVVRVGVGASQAASSSGSRTTGIRSWIGRSSSFGSQVTIAQLCRTPSPERSVSSAQMPAKANSSPPDG